LDETVHFVCDEGGAPPGWERLEATSPLFGQSIWFSLMGKARPEDVWCVALSEGRPVVGFRGTTFGTAAVSDTWDPWALLFDRVPTVRTLPEEVLPELEDAGGADLRRLFFPALVFCYPGYDVFPIGGGEGRRDLLEGLVAHTVEHARRQAVATVSFLYVDPQREGFEDALRAAGFVGFPGATRADLTLVGHDFDAYVAALSGNQRANLRKIRRTLGEAGVTVTRRDLRDVMEDVLALRLLHKKKHGRRFDEAEERSMLEAFAGPGLAERVTLFVATAEARTIGFALFLWDDLLWHAMFTGSDYDDPRHKNAYFELMFYAPIEHAYRHGIRRLSFGYGTEEAKRRRGCTITTTRSWVYPIDDTLRGPIDAAAGVLERWARGFELSEAGAR
jgi:hypothetical protein